MSAEIEPPIYWKCLGEVFYDGCFDNNQRVIDIVSDYFEGCTAVEAKELLEFLEIIVNQKKGYTTDAQYVNLLNSDYIFENPTRFLGELHSSFKQLQGKQNT